AGALSVDVTAVQAAQGLLDVQLAAGASIEEVQEDTEKINAGTQKLEREITTGKARLAKVQALDAIAREKLKGLIAQAGVRGVDVEAAQGLLSVQLAPGATIKEVQEDTEEINAGTEKLQQAIATAARMELEDLIAKARVLGIDVTTATDALKDPPADATNTRKINDETWKLKRAIANIEAGLAKEAGKAEEARKAEQASLAKAQSLDNVAREELKSLITAANEFDGVDVTAAQGLLEVQLAADATITVVYKSTDEIKAATWELQTAIATAKKAREAKALREALAEAKATNTTNRNVLANLILQLEKYDIDATQAKELLANRLPTNPGIMAVRENTKAINAEVRKLCLRKNAAARKALETSINGRMGSEVEAARALLNTLPDVNASASDIENDSENIVVAHWRVCLPFHYKKLKGLISDGMRLGVDVSGANAVLLKAQPDDSASSKALEVIVNSLIAAVTKLESTVNAKRGNATGSHVRLGRL
ncbi:MAG: hypothetical protein LBB26_04435, partial [Puniceicoccales bacterium]|nr:hypothetical protein [Puniceicoccales bacterium]